MWKFEDGTPLVTQIVERLRSDIVSGVYVSGGDFPTTRQLAREAGVNPNTMQKAIAELEKEGIVVTDSTNGRLVSSDTELISRVREELTEAKIADALRALKALSLDIDTLIDLIRKGWDKDNG